MRKMFGHFQLPLLVALFFSAGTILAEEFRTFTNKDGKSISAKVISIELEKATAKLELDSGQVFDVPISTLSIDDQGYLAGWNKAKEKIEHPRGWKQVVVHLPGIQDKIAAPGIYGAFYRIGARTWAGEIPEGAWLRIESEQPGEWVSTPELIFQYDGTAADLRFTFGEGLFRLDEDSANNPKVVGVTCPVEVVDGKRVSLSRISDRDETYKMQLRLVTEAVAELPEGSGICLQASTPFQDGDGKRFQGKIHSIVAWGGAKDEIVDLARIWNVKGVRIASARQLGELLATPLESLEFLSSRADLNDVSWLGRQPNLTTIQLNRIYPDWALSVIRQILTLRFVEIRSFMGSENVYSLEGWSDLKDLQGVDFDTGYCKISADSIAQCETLEAVRFDDPTMDGQGEWLRPLSHLRNIYFTNELGSKAISNIMESEGRGKGLRFVKNYNTSPFEFMPRLRAHIFPGARTRREKTITRTLSNGRTVRVDVKMPYQWSHAGLESLEQIEYLYVDGVSQGFLDQLAFIKHPERLKTLILRNLYDCDDLGVLKELTGLKVLAIHDIELSIPDLHTEPQVIDLREMTSLEAFEYFPGKDGERVLKIEEGELEYLRITDDPYEEPTLYEIETP